MSQAVRRVGCSVVKLLVEQNKLLINDFDTVSEFATFSREPEKVKFEAEKGCHDDTVMTCVIFAWLSDQDWFKENTDIKTLKNLREQDSKQTEDELIPFGFVDRGPPPKHEEIEWNPTDTMLNKRGNMVSWLVYDDKDDPLPNF